MKIYTLNEDEFNAVIEKMTEVVIAKLSNQPEPWKWVGTNEAMMMLGISSKTTLQDLRDKQAITYTQPMAKVILYDRNSIAEYLEKHSKKAL